MESERLRALLAEIGGENISIRRQSFAGSSESSRSSTPATVPLRRTESDRTHNSSDLLGLATGSALRSLPSFPDVDIDVEGVNSVPAEPIKGIALMDDMELAGNTAGFVSLHSESTDRTSNLVIDQDHSMIGILSGEDNTTITNEAVMSPAKQGNPLASYASSSKLDDNVIDIEQVQETLRGRTSSGSSEVDDLDILAMRQAQLQRHLHLRNSFRFVCTHAIVMTKCLAMTPCFYLNSAVALCLKSMKYYARASTRKVPSRECRRKRLTRRTRRSCHFYRIDRTACVVAV